MPVCGQRRTLAPTRTLSTRTWARWWRLDAAALTSASAVAGGTGPARMARVVARSKRVAVGLTGAGGGMTGEMAKVTGTDDAFASKCHAVGRRSAAFGAALCAYVAWGCGGSGTRGDGRVLVVGLVVGPTVPDTGRALDLRVMA